MANEVLEVVGRGARDAVMVASGSTIISVDLVGGFETFASSSYNTGRAPRSEVVRPDSDVTTDNWTPLTLFSRLNEATPDGGDTEIASVPFSSVAPSSSVAFFEVGLTNLNSSTEVANAAVSLTVAKSGSFEALTGSLGDSTASLTVEVRQGAVAFATRTFPGIGTAFETVDFALTDNELAAVSEWDDVRINAEFELSVSTASSAVEARVTQAQIQLTLSTVIKAPPVDNTIWRIVVGS